MSLKGGVGQVGDEYEKNADAVADQVVQGKSAQSLLDAFPGGSAEKGVQRRVVQMDGESKNPLTETKYQIKNSFGKHGGVLDGVKSHTGPAAEETTASIGSTAYASHLDIVFGKDPTLHTAAHEAAHTVQQKSGVSLEGGVLSSEVRSKDSQFKSRRHAKENDFNPYPPGKCLGKGPTSSVQLLRANYSPVQQSENVKESSNEVNPTPASKLHRQRVQQNADVGADSPKECGLDWLDTRLARSFGLERSAPQEGTSSESPLSTAENIQKKETNDSGENSEQIHRVAAEGTKGSGGALPFQEEIQKSFGNHDISGIQAFTGDTAKEAGEAMGAEAYATGNKISSAETPSLHTAAHEAAHVIQQRGGVSLKGDVGEVGDKYEQHADTVADLTVQGKSAEVKLDQVAGGAMDTSPVFGAPLGSDIQFAGKKEQVPSVTCDPEAGTHFPESCHLTSAQRSWLRGEVGDRINTAFTRYLDACSTVSDKLKAILKEQTEFLGAIVSLAFTAGFGKLISIGINKIPLNSPDWLVSAAVTVLDKPHLVSKPIDFMGSKIKENVVSRHKADTFGFVDHLKDEASLWSQNARGRIPSFSDSELIAQFATWDARYTSIASYESAIVSEIERFKTQVATLDTPQRYGAGNNHKRLVSIEHKMGFKRLALVWHDYSTMTHHSQQGEAVKPQIEKSKAALAKWRSKPEGPRPTREQYIKVPFITKSDRLRFIQWLDPDMKSWAKNKWSKTSTGKKEARHGVDIIDVKPERLEGGGGTQVETWLKEIDDHATKFGGSFQW